MTLNSYEILLTGMKSHLLLTLLNRKYIYSVGIYLLKVVMETSQVPLLILNRFHTFLSIVSAAFGCILVPFEWYGRPKKFL